jgi:hypothetical protein
MNLYQQVIRVKNLPGTNLNAACSGLAEARPKDGRYSECHQYTCILKDDGYKYVLSFVLDLSKLRQDGTISHLIPLAESDRIGNNSFIDS